MVPTPPGDRLFWRLYASVYDLIWDAPVSGALAASVASRLEDPVINGDRDGGEPGRLVIDLGCGTGLATANLSDRGWRVVGVDASTHMLCRAEREGRVGVCVAARAEETGLPDACADAVVVSNLLQMHADPVLVLDEASRLARPGASLVLTWPVEGLTPSRMFAVDRASGRSLAGCLCAAWARGAVSRVATVLGARASRSGPVRSDMLALVGGWAGELDAVSATVVAGCQCVVVVKTSTLPTEEPRGADVEAVRRPGRGATSGRVGPSGRSCVSAVNPGRPELPPS